ncbi:uncharacterized protein EV422DRAFT_603341, partial [Fimicolochytrium jonesii]|uniref:uncharacterized protein n=1 Tax=Fimicolochytrium jonesii TaxID=1396493 RepID=UPI0022FDD537
MTVQPPLPITEAGASAPLAPRAYQQELFRKAVAGNVIAVLDTGAGKTLIAVMLLKHMTSLKQQRAAKRPSIFLVPLVPLVLQQEAYIRFNCQLNVKHYYGSMGVDDWNYKRWQTEISEADVMVMTADIFRLILNRGHISMERVTLIIFDEAHHARKNHSYNQIMSHHYQRCPVELRPKIFGMTASPTFAKQDSKDAIDQLETNLDCKAYTVHTDSMAGHVSRPDEEIVYYRGVSDAFLPAIYYLIRAAAGPAYHMLEKAMDNALEFCEQLGSWCAARALEKAIADAHDKLHLLAFMRKTNAHLRVGVDEAVERKVMEKVQRLKTYIELAPNWGGTGSAPHIEEVSPKVHTLIKILLGYKDEAATFCGIVFVQKRSTATALQALIEKWPGLGFLKSSILVGHGRGKSSTVLDVNMQIKEQKRIVGQFRTGELNLLIATRVAEEGLDIRECMLVIRFDANGTLTNFIQSRGRARHIKSRFVTLSNIENPSEAIDIAALKREEERMRNVLFDRAVDNDMEDDSPYDHNLQLSEDEIYHIESTGATVTIFGAIGGLEHYCSLLPKDAFALSRPIFEEEPVSFAEGAYIGPGYLGNVTLPMAAPKSTRFIRGKVVTSKRAAKRWAAFEAIKVLHRAGELDDRLKPFKIQPVLDDAEMDLLESQKGRMKKVKKKQRKIMEFRMRTPSLLQGQWDSSVGAWLTKITLDSDTPGVPTEPLQFGLLSVGDRPLPSESFDFILAEQNVTMTTTTYATRVIMTDEKLRQTKKFHSVFFRGILRSDVPDDGDWATIVVPTTAPKSTDILHELNTDPNAAIDWEAIQIACQGHQPVLDDPNFLKRDDIANFAVFDRVFYKRVYLITRVVPETTPFSDLPTGNAPHVAGFYQTRLQCREKILEDQLIIEARSLPYITQSASTQESLAAKFLIPQFCTIFPIPARLLQGNALHLPLIVQYLHHRLVARDLKYLAVERAEEGQIVDDESYRELSGTVSDLQTALTAPVANPVFNYERLETLGDSFLKVHQSIHLFVMYPEWHEGHLSQKRNNMEKNSALRERAGEVELETYVLGTALSRKEWTPPLQRGEGGATQRLSDKTVADVVEAIIGACVLRGGELGGAKAVKKLLGGDYEIDWARYCAIYKERRKSGEFRTPGVDVAERELGYKFKDPSLCMEALTHASAAQLALQTDCYQRLEFLGDSVLGFVVTRYLYILEPPLDPGQISHLRSELVNNQFLAVVSWNMSADDTPLDPDASFTSTRTTSTTTTHTSTSSTSSQLFWNALDSAPKAAGDVYESMIGAVFIDSGFLLDTVARVVHDTLIKPYWARFER